jgi:hypothetical protein
MSTLKEFAERAKADEKLQTKFKEAATKGKDEAIGLLKQHGIADEEIQKALEAFKSGKTVASGEGELTDEQLGAVAGGSGCGFAHGLPDGSTCILFHFEGAGCWSKIPSPSSW